MPKKSAGGGDQGEPGDNDIENMLRSLGKTTTGGAPMSTLSGGIMKSKRQSTMQLVGCTTVAVVALLFVIGIFMSGFVVTAGNVGVVTTFGRVEPGVLYPGFHLRLPFVNQIHQIDVRVQPHPFKEIDAASMEQQSVKLTGMMNYHLDPAQANDLYQRVGLDFATKVIDPAFSDFIKEVVPQYRAAEILQKRDEVRRYTKEKLAQNLERYGIIVDDIYISNIAFSPEYQQAIEQKQTAQQNVGREEQMLAQKEIQAKQKLVDAKADADSSIERARGEAESNRVRAQSITPELIRYLETTKWDGKLPQVAGGATPLVSIGQPVSPTPPSPGQPGSPAPAPSGGGR
ncbi:MAG: prohibitin family protein [Chloroflexi bacterium]|nr:prohibitin family protein [Chloroflexota bacterium]